MNLALKNVLAAIAIAACGSPALADTVNSFRQAHGLPPLHYSRAMQAMAQRRANSRATRRKSRKRGLGMRDGKLYDQYLGKIGGTPGKHAAVWHSQLWHGIGHQWGTALLVLGPWPVALTVRCPR